MWSDTIGGVDPTRAARRGDIQGLRAVAVALVLAYHFLPGLVPGGFIGVDVFFVISGFLITGHLVAHPPRRPRDLTEFWARRIRRLLPAALVVLVATMVATRLFLPETTWERGAEQTRSATIYLVNWMLALDAVDYLAADRAVTGVHHYWSLAVEEQFYVLWPLLVMAVAWLALRWARHHDVVLAWTLGALVALSFAWSVHLTDLEPARAYFATTTRVWELAAGGLLACLVRRCSRGSSVRSAWLPTTVAWLGVTAIVAAAFAFDARTLFPGPWAMVPVLGTMAVIWAEPVRRASSPGGFLALAPLQWVGDHSYSIYLWHWPLLTVAAARAVPMRPWVLVAVLVATLVLAAVTKRLVEDPFRTPQWRVRPRATWVSAGVATATVLAVTFLQLHEVDQRRAVDLERLEAVQDELGSCFGAAALDPGRECEPYTGTVVPGPARAATDFADVDRAVTGRHCLAQSPDFVTIACSFGSGDTTVALVGNSHAGHWLPALQKLAAERGWRITTHLASSCAVVATDLAFATPRVTEKCRDWSERTVQDVVDEQPDLVFFANQPLVRGIGASVVSGSVSENPYIDGYTQVLQRLADAGLRVVVLEDTPAPERGGVVVPECLATYGEHAPQCDGTRALWMLPEPDPVRTAVQRVGSSQVTILDPTDWFCEAEACRAVVGGVVVYFDGSHLTATYARTLAGPLERALVETGVLHDG